MKNILKLSVLVTITMLFVLTSCGSMKPLTEQQQKERRAQLLEARREARSKN